MLLPSLHRSTFLSILVVLPASALPCFAQGWSQYNGANSDRRSGESVSLRTWPDAGPPRPWTVPMRRGFSSLTLGNGRAYTLVGREGSDGFREACVALDLESGKELWSRSLGSAEYDGGGNAGAGGNKGGDGPRSTPSHDGERVYVFDAGLGLHCLNDATGEVVWSHDLASEYGGRSIKWQNAASPLVEGDKVFVAAGGEGQSLLAFDKHNGALAWKLGDESITHATPIAATLHGIRQVIFFVQSGLVAVSPDTGDVLWTAEYPYRTSSAASPVVYENRVYCSAGYGVGAGVFEIHQRDGRLEAELLWQKRNRLINHWSTPVVHDGFLYGMFSFKEYGEGPLQCVELATGEIRWSQEGFGPGNCILVGDLLVALSDAGEVVLAAARSDEYRELARHDVLEGKCWSSPAYAEGQLYVRSTSQATRLDLSGQGSR